MVWGLGFRVQGIIIAGVGLGWGVEDKGIDLRRVRV